jgi:uncharacterized protein involved in exopolysaccharide biosynthesis
MIKQDRFTDETEESRLTASPSEDNATMFGLTGLAIAVLTQLASHKRLIATVTSVTALAGFVVALALPVRYTSVTRIMPPRQTQSTTTFLNSTPGMGAMGDPMSGGLSLRDPNAIYIGLLKSRPIADAVINRFNLMAVYHTKDMTATRTELQNNTTVASDTSTLISISVIDGNKKRAAEMANAYTEQLRILSKTISVTEASKRRLFFEEQLKSQKEALVEAELALEQVQQRGGLVRPDAQAALIVSNLSLLRGQIAAKEVQLQGLRSYSTEHNPQVQLVERELTTMQGQAAHMEQHAQPAGYSDLGLRDVPKAGLEYARAARELQYEQALFDLLLRQFEAAKLDEAKEAAVIQVVEPGIEPERKSSPHSLLILVLSTIGGFFISCLFIWILWWRDVTRSDPETVRAIQDLRRALRGSL